MLTVLSVACVPAIRFVFSHSFEFSGICLEQVLSLSLLPAEDRECRAMDCVPEMIPSLLCISLWGLCLQGVFQALGKHLHPLWALCLAGVDTWFTWRFSAMKLLGLNPDAAAGQRVICVAINAVVGTCGENASRLTASRENQVQFGAGMSTRYFVLRFHLKEGAGNAQLVECA